MSNAKSPVIESAVASDPELVRLERRMRELQEQAESRMAEVETLSKGKRGPDLLEDADRLLTLMEGVTRLIAQNHKLRQRYQRRRDKLEAERARRVAGARAAFLMAEDDSPSGATRH
jgi:hypothetical protein